MDPSQERKACLKLAQLYTALKERCHINVIGRILDKEGDISYALQEEGPSKISKLHYTGYTALHFACLIKNIALVDKLLDHEADFTKKSKDGKTALHLSLEHDKNFTQVFDCLAVRKIEEENKNFTQPLNNLLVNSVLTAHLTRNNFSNPCDKNGLSHLHIACRTNNSEIVQFFLANGASVDESTSINSKYSPGYTPLHFAAMCLNTKTIEILLAYGANIHIADANGKTPLHILVERKIEMFNSIDHYPWRKDDHLELQELIRENDKIINILLENASTDNDCLDHIGLSNFHVACTLEDSSIAERLADQGTNIDHAVNKDSMLWPGYTPLHFAANFSLSTVEILVKRGADMGSKDATGLTPLDICIKRYKIEDVCKIISFSANWKKILFSDGKTKLIPLISSLADTNTFKNIMQSSIKNIDIHIPMKSPLWPGYTPLHLAVLFSERPRPKFGDYKNTEKETSYQIIRFCLSQGADLRVQDIRGQSALHLAFRLDKTNVVDLIFRQCREVPNATDDENLSHLHIACAARLKTPNLKKCVLKAGEVNAVFRGASPVNGVRPGWTPLHLSLVNSDAGEDLRGAVNSLLRYGADPNAKDARGLTPIHWTLKHDLSYAHKFVANKLLQRVSDDSVAELYNVSYLHVACKIADVAALRGLLKNGPDVNLAIAYADPENHDEPLSFLSHYDRCTPLLCSPANSEMEKLLVEHGADVFAKKADGSTAFDRTSVLTHFIQKLWNDVELQNRMRREFGWTKLHLACQLPSVFGNEIQSIVETRPTDINARVSSNSPVWKGCTPLHLLIHFAVECYSDSKVTTYPFMKTLLEVLLDEGADVTTLNDEQNSPIGMIFQNSAGNKYINYAALLMKFHRNFNVNPVNAQGVSHFHVACYVNDVDAVEGFLLHGADVNGPIDLFSDFFPGSTPLHLASKLPVVNLLISHGADVQIEDVNGFNALQEAVKRDPFDKSVVTKIIESGSEINSPNFRGMTPFETAISHDMTTNKLLFFMRQGFIVNSCNSITGVGYISILLTGFDRIEEETTSIVEMMMMSQSSTNILGRTTLHHLVTSKWSHPSFIVFIEKLLKSGHDIDEQDRDGKTALHLAYEFHNDTGFHGLLLSGADINVLNLNGRSVLSYAMDRSTLHAHQSLIHYKLIIYARRMILLKLDLNQPDADRLSSMNKLPYIDVNSSYFLRDIKRSKGIKIGVRDMRLHDFLSETNAVLIYSSLNQSERQRIYQFFETIDSDSRVKEIQSLLKLQYGKAIKRLDYYDPATNSLRSLLGFDLPDLCAENIFLYLSTFSLKNLILAGDETENKAMDVN